MTNKVGSESDVKKPWESKTSNAGLIFLGLLLISYVSMLFFPINYFLYFIFFFPGTFMLGYGIYIVWILYRFWPDLNEKRDKIGGPIVAVVLIVFGILFSLISFGLNPQSTYPLIF